MIQPYYDNGKGITIYHADCRDVLPILEAGSVDLVLTDPPYGLGLAEWDAVSPTDVLPQLLRVGGSVLWFASAQRLAADILAMSSPPERTLVWAPSFTMSHARANGIAYRWHPIYAWRLPRRHEGPKWDVLTVPTEVKRNGWYHPGKKPLNLMLALVGFCQAQDLILDPFLGSGTTLVAAKRRGRRAIGIEIEERYCEIAANRLQQEVLPLEAVTC